MSEKWLEIVFKITISIAVLIGSVNILLHRQDIDELESTVAQLSVNVDNALGKPVAHTHHEHVSEDGPASMSVLYEMLPSGDPPTEQTCRACGGSGIGKRKSLHKKRPPCSVCKGSKPSPIPAEQTCRRCNGEGAE